MVKTAFGEDLAVDDAPAKSCELFLVDGMSVAYRAFYGLPEELATKAGEPTNAIFGFANTLVKLLTEYRPRAVAFAWDSRPTVRLAAAPDYKANRGKMPEKLRVQLPHLRPLVEAFGYENIEAEGWEADDVLATLAARADRANIRTCVVSTDRDAFQLVSEHVCLMMTPRSAGAPQVYTPERVRARYGISPELIPDLIALRGDTADNIPSVPGFGEKTAAVLLAQYGSLEALFAHASELPPAKRSALEAHADRTRASKALAKLRFDLDVPCDPAVLVHRAPDRTKLAAMLERFELKRLAARIGERS